MKSLISSLIITLLLLPYILTFSSCTAIDSSSKDEEYEKMIVFRPYVGVNVTKSTDVSFETGDVISVFAVEETAGGDGLLSSSNYADNIRYRFDSGRFVAEDCGIFYPESGASLSFKAVYPYISSASKSFYFDVSTNQNDSSGLSDSDLMTAVTSATLDECPELKFDHKMVSVTIKLNTGIETASSAVRMMNVQCRSLVNLDDNTVVSASGKCAAVYGKDAGDGYFKFIIPPQTFPSDAEMFNVIIDQQVYAVFSPKQYIWRSGKAYSYEIIFDGYSANPQAAVSDEENRRYNNMVINN